MRNIFLAVLVASAFLAGCGKDASQGSVHGTVPINLSMAITKATESGFETGDRVGLYVVNSPSLLSSGGNQYDNALLKLGDSGWEPAIPLYYKDEKTLTDFYAYYPYRSNLDDIKSVRINVQSVQTTEESYNASDFLWGKTIGVIPSENTVSLKLSHLTSRVNVVLKAGNGWTADDLKTAEVTICGLNIGGTVDLTDGSVKPLSGTDWNIMAFNNGDGTFKAMVIPQTLSKTEFVKIAIGTNEYTLTTGIELLSGMEHTCTITVNKTGGSFSVVIGGWETDEIDHGGSVE